MEQSPTSSLAAYHKTLAQYTHLTAVKWPDLVPRVGVGIGPERHDPGPRIPSKHL